MGFMAQATGSPNAGIGVLTVLFVIGGLVFHKADRASS